MGGDEATGHGGAVRKRCTGGDRAKSAQRVSAVVAVVAAVQVVRNVRRQVVVLDDEVAVVVLFLAVALRNAVAG